MEILTTITPQWKRPDMLRSWVKSIRGSIHPFVKHLVYFVRDLPPDWWDSETADLPILAVCCPFDPPGLSIGHYHNDGAEISNSEWIMKMDVDTIWNVDFFKTLIPFLCRADQRQWFNCGMVLLTPEMTAYAENHLPLSVEKHEEFLFKDRPVSTNFICRRKTYLKYAQCESAFRGWGYEDYQQIYDLERYQLRRDPLPGDIDINTLTQRCRDEISRPKAMELFGMDKRLCLFHKWHPKTSPGSDYRASAEKNRMILFQHINKARSHETQNVLSRS